MPRVQGQAGPESETGSKKKKKYRDFSRQSKAQMAVEDVDIS